MMTSNDTQEVDDYMSDTFLPQESDDIRPTLLFSHSLRVKHKSMKRKSKSDPKPKSFYNDLEHRLRDEALNTPLDKSNIGFKMLTKMGFKQPIDPQLAEDTNKGVNVVNPIKIELKNDRKGLGCQPKVVKNIHKSDPIDEKLIEDNYLSHKKFRHRLLLSQMDLKTSQTVCRNLDIKSGLDEIEFKTQTVRPKWFWPQFDNEEEDSDEEDVEEYVKCNEQKLREINEYLRHQYFYCIWCGMAYNDSQDLIDNCLGDTRDHHQ